jgi:hypothetical protein
MRAAALTLAALLIVLVAAPADARTLIVNGDSLAVGTEPYLPGALPGWRIETSASISRHASEGAPLLSAQGSLPEYIAMSLGTNDDPSMTDAFRSAIDQTMEVAGERCVVWVNIYRPAVAGTSYDGYNSVLAEESQQRPNLRVVDWHALVSQHPEWLGPDGVHVNATGYQARARALAQALRECGQPGVAVDPSAAAASLNLGGALRRLLGLVRCQVALGAATIQSCDLHRHET